MKKLLFSYVLLICCISGFSQNSKLHIDLNYPFPIGDNFIGKNYHGIVDLGISYMPIKVSKLKLGISTNVGLLSTNAGHSEIPVHASMIKPRLNAEIVFRKLTPYVGIGYSFFKYKVSSIYSIPDKTTDGLNLNCGVRYNLISGLYIKLDYDFIKFRVEDLPDISYNKNIMILNFGVGFSI
jgi:hypothetical protein